MIAIKPSHEGLLHKHMGIKRGRKISVADLMSEKASAKREGDTAEEKRANFALVAKTKWHHK